MAENKKTDKINITTKLLKKITQQLIRADGMKVTEDYLIKQHIYYIDNTDLIEKLEKILMEHYYTHILEQNGYVNLDTLYQQYNPLFINSDSWFIELEKKHNKTVENNENDGAEKTEKNKKKKESNLNQYF